MVFFGIRIPKNNPGFAVYVPIKHKEDVIISIAAKRRTNFLLFSIGSCLTNNELLYPLSFFFTKSPKIIIRILYLALFVNVVIICK